MAYSFDEGSGTTATDASGNNRTATLLNGAGWAAGHSGSAASFDGINDYASAGNIAALNGLTAVTVSAWIKGSVGTGSSDAIIVAKDAAFALVVSGGAAHKAQFGVKSGNTWYGFPNSTTSVDDGAFHFLTGVYDGTTVRIYVDGAQEGSTSIGARTLGSPSAALQVASCVGGPNCAGTGELWHGVVDDVRIYNRALSQAEIQTDRSTPVSGADSTPPSTPTNVAGTAISATQVTLTWTASTDNVGVTGYQVFRNSALIGTSGTPSFADSGLTPSTTYTYAIAAVDAALNTSAASLPIPVTTLAAPDTTPPTVPSNVMGTATSATQVSLTWTASTDNVGVTGYQVFRNTALIGTSSTPSFADSGLSPSTTYTYAVAAVDAALNTSAASLPIPVTTLAATDGTPPTMPSNLVGTGVSSSQINLTWTASTDNVGVTGYQVFRNSLLIGTAGTPSFTDTGLTPSTTYTYTVTALDAALNTSAPSTAVAVTTQAAGLSALASDNFDRPNGGPGANWTVIDSDPRIVNQHLQETNTTDGNDSIAIYTALTWPADQYSQLTVQAATSHSGCAAIVRTKNDPVIEMYFVYVVGPLGPRAQLVLAKFVRHVYAELWSSVLPVNAGDVVYLSASGTTLTVKLNGTTLTTQTDGSITAAGYPGIDVTDYDGRGAPGDGQCDNWEGGAVGNLLAAPTNLAGTAVSSSQVNLSWTASTGAAGYKVFRNGTQAGSSVTTSYSDSGLTLGTTYTYAVAAYTSDGTTSPSSAPIAVTTQGDTTPPSAPTGLAGTAISSSQINLTWTASTDNVGVASYKVFRNGSQIGTSGTPSFADSGLLASTTYTYGVSATDLAGNPSALSVPTSVTTNGATPSIPIVAFAFDEATGSIANDASGNGNQGTLINGPTWSAGHSGSAVSFDGINDYVSAGNIAALNGLTAVTVSTWIKGSVGASSPDAIIVAKDAAFALVVSDGVPHKAQFGVKSGNTWYGFPSSTTSVDDGAFHFVTGVYDGATVRVYVDGVQQGSSSVGARTLTAPSTSLQVASCLGGPNCDSSGEMWHGLVDDVRVYNRALTASEIVTDMNNAVH